MPQVLRTENDVENPHLARLYNRGITRGLNFYTKVQGSRVAGISILCEGARFDGDTACDGIIQVLYRGFVIPEFDSSGQRNWRFHDGRMTSIPDFNTVTANSSNNTFTSNSHNLSNNDVVKIIAEAPASQNPAVPGGLTEEKVKYYVISATTNTFKLSSTLGGSEINLTSNGSGTLRVYRANKGFDDAEQGRPEFFPNFNFTLSGICYIEWRLPERFGTEEDNPTEWEFILDGKQVKDITHSNEVLSFNTNAIKSTNNALISLDFYVNDAKMPLTYQHLGQTIPRFKGSSWTRFRDICDAQIPWSGGNNVQGVLVFATSSNFDINASNGSLYKSVSSSLAVAASESFANTILDSSIEVSVDVGQISVGYSTSNSASQNPNYAIRCDVDGKLYFVEGASVSAVGTWAQGDKIKVTLENRVFKAYQNEVPITNAPARVAPSASLYGIVYGGS